MTGEVSWERPLERAQDVEIAKIERMHVDLYEVYVYTSIY